MAKTKSQPTMVKMARMPAMIKAPPISSLLTHFGSSPMNVNALPMSICMPHLLRQRPDGPIAWRAARVPSLAPHLRSGAGRRYRPAERLGFLGSVGVLVGRLGGGRQPGEERQRREQQRPGESSPPRGRRVELERGDHLRPGAPVELGGPGLEER